MNYNYYNNMTSKEKDQIAEGSSLPQNLHEYQARDPQHQRNQMKRQLTTTNEMRTEKGADPIEMEDSSENFSTPRSKKSKRNGEKKENNGTATATSPEGNKEHREEQRAARTKENRSSGFQHQSGSRITKFAMDYAVDHLAQPFKIECDPKVKDTPHGAKIINGLISHNKKDFATKNPNCSRPLMFDVWWIDGKGDIQIIVKSTELFVHLCNAENYPKELANTKITPHPPKHFPPKHTAIMKWVDNAMSIDEIKEGLKVQCPSIASVENMMGPMNERNRHIRIEFWDRNEFSTALHNGKINLHGQLFNIDEFIPSPRMLICTRCNCPGHTKKMCQNSKYDMCRRCGEDRSDKEKHSDCTISCHHCGAAHMSTDYKCPKLQEYRRHLIDELRKHPERLSADIQIFIPSEYRPDGNRVKCIHSGINQQHQRTRQQSAHQRSTSMNDTNVWRHMKECATTPPSSHMSACLNEICETMKGL